MRGKFFSLFVLLFVGILFIQSNVFAADDYPIIFVHGQQADGRASTGLKTWYPPDPDRQTAMMKVVGYKGYQYGLKSNSLKATDCNETTELRWAQGSKRIFNFSYYHVDGSPGATGSNGNLVPVGAWERPRYQNNISQGTWADNLAEFIDKVLQATGASQVDIVAHSTGGLVAKSAITYYGCESKVRKFLMVGTPNHGAETDWKVCVALDIASKWEDWLHLGEGLELGIDRKLKSIGIKTVPPYVDFVWEAYYNTTFGNLGTQETGGWCELLNNEWEERLQKNEINVKFSIITGKRDPFNELVGYSGVNDGVVKKDWCVPVWGSSFEPTIYASHSSMDRIYAIRADAKGELALTECTFTSAFVKKWIIDDEVIAGASIVGGTITGPSPWPDTEGEPFCGDIRAGIGVNDYKKVLSLSTFLYTEALDPVWNQGIPLCECVKGMPGNPVTLSKPNRFAPGLYILQYLVNDMNGEVGTAYDNGVAILIYESPYEYATSQYTSKVINGSFIYMLEPRRWRYDPGETIWIKWLSNEYVLSRKIYFSTDGGDTYEEIFDLGPRTTLNGKPYVRDSVQWTLPTEILYGCRIKIEENLDNVNFLIRESHSFRIKINVPAQISNFTVTPVSGYEHGKFTYSFDYYDEDGDPLKVLNLCIDGQMVGGLDIIDCLKSGTWSDGTWAFETSDLAPGVHNYYFEVMERDEERRRFPETGTFTGPIVYPNPLSEGQVSPEEGSQFTNFTYSIKYDSPYSDRLTTKLVFIEDFPENMSLTPSYSPEMQTYSYSTKLYTGRDYNYYFYFRDAAGRTSRYPSEGYLSGPEVFGWKGRDVGGVESPGSVELNDGTFTLYGSGEGISEYGNNDEFYSFYQQRSGDMTIIAKIENVERIRDNSQAGIMIRQSLDPSSRHTAMILSARRGSYFVYSLTMGGNSVRMPYPFFPNDDEAPCWLKLKRDGNKFDGYTSQDGSKWDKIGFTLCTFPEDVYVGLVVSSHKDGDLCEAVFSNVMIEGGSYVGSSSDQEQSMGLTFEPEMVYDNYIRPASTIVSDNVTLDISSNIDRNATVEIIDIAGRCIKSERLNINRGQQIMSFGKFNTGIYFLRIISAENEKPEIHKITVIR